MIAFPVSREPAKEASVYMKLLEMKEEKENSEVKMKGPNQSSLHGLHIMIKFLVAHKYLCLVEMLYLGMYNNILGTW